MINHKAPFFIRFHIPNRHSTYFVINRVRVYQDFADRFSGFIYDDPMNRSTYVFTSGSALTKNTECKQPQGKSNIPRSHGTPILSQWGITVPGGMWFVGGGI